MTQIVLEEETFYDKNNEMKREMLKYLVHIVVFTKYILAWTNFWLCVGSH
jgi:hypothetical protein